MLSILLAAIIAPLVRAGMNPPGTVGWYTPTTLGGSWFNDALNGYGEPLNVIITATSDQRVLTNDGVLNYAKAIGFSTECLGLHLGDPFPANLGDGNGWVNQTMELREDYGMPDVGTCGESLVGGNHFRVYRQDGPIADSGALFLAVSIEEDVFENHTVEPNGYNLGRDALAASAVGRTSYGGITYNTTVLTMYNQMPVGVNGVNHGIAVDGTVIMLTVNIL